MEDQSQGRRGLCVVADATGGSALDCDLARQKNRRHRWAAPAPIGLARCRRSRNGEQPHTQGSGASRPASAAVPRQRSRARGVREPRPGRGPTPPLSVEDLVAALARSHAFLTGASRLQLSVFTRARRRMACRRRALEAVEKVVTGSRIT